MRWPNNLPNHLADQKSPYLLQHADNPVDWYPWTSEALGKAQKEQKPILLSIGYSTCHWCHVMAHESFENLDTAKFINEHFVAIKVDREERPDLDQIYMSAVTAMTGQGGWPLTVFLTPQGKPFYGGTYFPPLAKWGSPGFMDLLKTVAHAWKNQNQDILSTSEKITQLLHDQTQKIVVDAKTPSVLLLEMAYLQITSQFDRKNGGFGSAPKFPMGHQLSFLLRYYKRSHEAEALEIVERTLTAIAHGGIYDHLGGGFHRYSTDANWHVPHFEKMLYDQALLTKTYLESYQLTGNAHYARIAKETLDYVLRDMQQPEGGFYCAEDADSLTPDGTRKSEGAYYIWSKEEITGVLAKEEAEIFNYAFGVAPEGNAKFDPHDEFQGKNILYLAHSLEDVASQFNIDVPQAQEILNKAKSKLFDFRKGRSRPHLDDKILTDWNGLMLGVLSFAGVVLGEERYITAAKRAADFMLLHLKRQGRLLHCWRQGQADILATLEDYAFFINGLIDLYEASFDEQYLNEAKGLTEDMINLFEDRAQGGFYLTANDAPELIIRPKEIYDGAIPSGNSVAAYVLVRIQLLTLEDKWLAHVENIFKVFFTSIEERPPAYTFALCALDFYLGPSLNIVLEGPLEDSKLAQMKRVVYKYFIPNKSLLFKPSTVPATVYVCQLNVCQKPTQEISELEKQLLQQ